MTDESLKRALNLYEFADDRDQSQVIIPELQSRLAQAEAARSDLRKIVDQYCVDLIAAEAASDGYKNTLGAANRHIDELEAASHQLQAQLDEAKLRSYRTARVYEPNMDCYHAALATYAAAFGKPDGEPHVVLPSGELKQLWELSVPPESPHGAIAPACPQQSADEIAAAILREMVEAAHGDGIGFDDEQVGFIEQALSDAAQEAMNHRAPACPQCGAKP